MNRAELKSQAKAQIKGKIGILFLITLLIGLISGAAGSLLSMIPGGGVIVSIVVAPAFALSLCRVYLLVNAGEKPEVKDAFSGFDDFWSAFKVTFLVGLYTFLWSLLFYIPGIIKAISYSMAPYILMDNPGITVGEAIDESKRITKGHKWQLFVLGLSFIGWGLVVVVTFGIAAIWVVPYIQATYANAYNAIKAPQATATTSSVNASDEEFLKNMF